MIGRHYFSKASVARAVICACLVIEISVAPPGHYRGSEFGFAWACLIASALGLVGDLLGWRASIRTLLLLPTIDILALTALGFFSLVASVNPYLPALQFALVLLSLREGSIVPGQVTRYGIAIGAIAASALLAGFVDEPLDPIQVWRLIGLVAMAALSVFAMDWFVQPAVSRPFAVDERYGNDNVLAEAVAYAMEQTDSSSATLISYNSDRAATEILTFGAAGDIAVQDLDFMALSKLNELKLMIFDLPHDKFMAATQDGGSVREQGGVPNPELWRQLGMPKGLCMPIGEADERAFVILPSHKQTHWTDLIAAERIRGEVNKGMRMHRSAVEGREAVMFRLRNAIARDLHDSITQTLAGARLMLSAIATHLRNDQAKRDLETIKESLFDEGVNLRHLVEQLRRAPDSGTRYDVIEELEQLLSAARSRWKVAAELQESQFRLLVPDWLSLEIQQLVREAISNGVRHGGADRISVACNRKQDEICLSITDNGTGFDVKKQKLPRSITERVAELSGTVEFRSKPGETSVDVRLPSVDF